MSSARCGHCAWLQAGVCLLAIAGSAVQAHAADMTVLQNHNSMEMHIIDTGAIVQRLLVPDANGQLVDIVAGFDDMQLYDNNTYSPYFGAVIGRVANRIAGASFVLDGERYNVSANEKGNTLHGGKSGWSVKTWNMSEIDSERGQAVKLTYTSPDGDEGFPNTVFASVTYTLTPTNEVIIDFEAISDGPTPINMAQHSYFNLEGPGTNKTILDHDVFINGSYVTPVDSSYIPTGGFEYVGDTPFSFDIAESIGSRINEIDSDPVGYDINYLLWGLNGTEALRDTHDCIVYDTPELAATVSSPISGRIMDVLTQSPGMQFYSGVQLNGSVIGKDDVAYPQYGMYVLETQDFPNFVNEPDFPGCILRPGNTYKYTTIWRFRNEDAAAAPSPSPAVVTASRSTQS